MSAGATGNRPGHEDTDARPRFIALIAGVLTALVAAGLMAGWGYVAAGKGVAAQPRISAPFQEGPQERTGVDRAWAQYERDTRAHLSGYGWVDRSAGIVRIPIDRAIDLVCAAERPAPAEPAAAHPAP